MLIVLVDLESDGAMSADSVGVDLSRLLDSPLFSDVTFKLGARSFHAHKAILHSRYDFSISSLLFYVLMMLMEVVAFPRLVQFWHEGESRSGHQPS